MRLILVIFIFFSVDAHSTAYHFCFSNSEIGKSGKSLDIHKKSYMKPLSKTMKI